MTATAQIGTLIDFTAGTPIVSADVDANFADIRTQFNRLVNSAGGVYIGDDADAYTTLGLTINQGANTDMILSLKSSSVDLGAALSLPSGRNVEADNFLAIHRSNSAYGGAVLVATQEAVSTGNPVFGVLALGGTPSTTKLSSSRSQIEFDVGEHDGAGSMTADVTTGANLFGVRKRASSSWESVMIVDAEGDLWIANDLQIDAGNSISFAGELTITRTASNVLTFAGGLYSLGALAANSSGIDVQGDANIGDAAGSIGFYDATPVALQTGVAVSAAGIHAALVNLGLITA